MPIVDAPMFRTRKSPVIFAEVEPLLTPSGWVAANLSHELEPSRHYLGYQVKVLGLPDLMGPPHEFWTYLVFRVAPDKLQLLQYAAAGVPGLIPLGDTSEAGARERFILEQVEQWQDRQDAAILTRAMQTA
jgi:hypothetical protein